MALTKCAFTVCRTCVSECSSSVLLFLVFVSSYSQNGKKTVTGMQVVTASQVQIVGCRSQTILAHPEQTVCVCVSVTMELDLGAQSSLTKKCM